MAWCSRPGGAGHGSLTLSPPGSSGPGHRILLVTETRCPPVPRLRTHGDGCAPGTTGGDPRSLTACRHRWRRRTSWVPHSHGLGRWWQVEGSLGALSASLPWDLPGKVPGCGAAAPLVLGARRAHHRTGPSKGLKGGGVRCEMRRRRDYEMALKNSWRRKENHSDHHMGQFSGGDWSQAPDLGMWQRCGSSSCTRASMGGYPRGKPWRGVC